MNTYRVGLSVAIFAGLIHAFWEILIFLGLAQRLLDFKLMMHSLNNPFVVSPFNLGTAIELVVLAIIGGYIVGALFATIFNKFSKI